LNYEGEIVIIIGKTCKNVSPEEAAELAEGEDGRGRSRR
jgi:5-oxopent-3-ene-1,2,5-tricarboxylate decarboxylase/2-hydroxyhepta-2,4-diene-1,7-dioate isomerase